MKSLVTGAAGNIGSHLCERLIADGHQVFGFDNLSGGKLSNLNSIKNHPDFHFIKGDVVTGNVIMAEESIEMLEVDWFFHLAAKSDIVPSIEKPEAYHDANVTGTIKMLQAARNMNVKKFVYAASSSCYGIPDHYPTVETDPCRPMYPYALTKYLGEQYVLHWQKVYGLPTISLRLFNVYSPRSRTSGAYGAVFGVFMSQLAHGKPLTVVGDGTQSRDFTFVSDVVDALVIAAESDKTGVYNVGSGSHYSVNKLVDLLGPTALVNIPRRPGEPDITFASIGKIKEDLGWEPKVSFKEGVSRMKALANQFSAAPLWTPESIAKATKTWFERLS